jgi:hypothetical protein
MSTAGRNNCDQIEARLVAGERAADDPVLHAHIGSCLRCFRTATELRELPRIEKALRQGPVFDPGPAFWAGFAAKVADAWQRERRGPAAVESPSIWKRLSRWLRMPVPAALGGAAVAAAVVTLALGWPAPPGPALTTPAGAPAPMATAAGSPHLEGIGPGGAGVLPGELALGADAAEIDDEFLRSLDVSGLQVLLEEIRRELPTALAFDQQDQSFDEDFDPDLASVVEELELLDEVELETLSRSLGRSI